jgi:predicted secreted protein
MRRFVPPLILLIALALPAFAGDASEYRFLGFSDDLKYCAFEISGVHDGSGFPYTMLYLIVVDSNDYAARPIETTGENGETPEEVRSSAEQSAAMRLKALRIDGSNIGTGSEVSGDHVLAAALQDEKGSYALRLVERDAGTDPDTDQAQKMFELDLVKDGRAQVLQKDSALPSGRTGAYQYGIRAAYINGGKVAVFIEYQRPGFEGPDTRQMIVTGALQKR